MVLGIAEDYSSNVLLDAELKALTSNGLYLNRGVHPSINVGNLLAFLPLLNFTFTAWDESVTYGVYNNDKNNIVTYDSKVYQSIQAGINQQPDVSPAYWLETNIESLRLKSFIESVKDRVYSDLNLTKRLVNNQFIYEVGKYEHTLVNDFNGWVIEPKGSDYVGFRLNQVSIQKSGTTPINLYVVNQGVLVDTLEITPSNGIVDFKDLDYTFKGKGQWRFVIDSTNVITNNGVVDPLKYDGFVVYSCSGIGEAPESAVYQDSTSANGLGINISAFLDSELYILNNLQNFGAYIRATFELMTFEMFQANAFNRSNRNERIQLDEKVITFNLFDVKDNTVAKRYYTERDRARKIIEKTFDTQLSSNNGFQITYSSL